MTAIKYIGMDVHLATISIAVLDAAGKLIMGVTIATQGGALLDFIRGLSGTLYVSFEEGTSALFADRTSTAWMRHARMRHARCDTPFSAPGGYGAIIGYTGDAVDRLGITHCQGRLL